MPHTVGLHRVLRAPPERVYRAFLNADAKAKWLPPHGFTGKVHALDATVGGSYRMSFTNFSTGHTHQFGGTYLELVPNERIRYNDRFEDPNLPGDLMVTITLKPVSCGTGLHVVQEGLPDVIPLQQCASDGSNRCNCSGSAWKPKWRVEAGSAIVSGGFGPPYPPYQRT